MLGRVSASRNAIFSQAATKSLATMNFGILAPEEKEQKASENISALLTVLQNMLQDMLGEVEHSHTLHKVGASTSLVTRLESLVKNPAQNLFKMSDQIDNQVKTLVDASVKAFLSSKENMIFEAVRSATSMNDLHYSIALREDNEESRAAIFDFLDQYDLSDISLRYPVHFQFVPTELMNGIRSQEKILPKAAA